MRHSIQTPMLEQMAILEPTMAETCGIAMLMELREAMDEAELIGLYQTASAWFEQQGLNDEAIELALSARDYDRAARLIELHVGWLFQHSELQTLAEYVGALPPAFAAQRLHLMTMRAWALMASGHFAEALRDVQTIEQIAGITEEDWKH